MKITNTKAVYTYKKFNMKIPKHIQEVIKNQEIHMLATSTKEGVPNIIYVTFLKVYRDDQVLIANNKFFKTERNLIENPRISFVVFDKENRKAYQLKGTVEMHKENSVYEDTVEWVKTVRPEMDSPKAGIILHVEEIYSGKEKVIEE